LRRLVRERSHWVLIFLTPAHFALILPDFPTC
jgi:hypothetical protein